MECIFCKQGVRQGVTLYRINETGVDGIWACEKHLKQTDVIIDPEMLKLTKLIENGGRHS